MFFQGHFKVGLVALKDLKEILTVPYFRSWNNLVTYHWTSLLDLRMTLITKLFTKLQTLNDTWDITAFLQIWWIRLQGLLTTMHTQKDLCLNIQKQQLLLMIIYC